MAHSKHTRETKTKILIAHIFQTMQKPVSLKEVFHYVQISLPKTSYSTVFRNVNLLKQTGKIIQIDWRERGSRYEWADMPHHHHIVCQICGSFTDLKECDVNFNEKKVSLVTGYIVKHHTIELEGICPKCQKSQK